MVRTHKLSLFAPGAIITIKDVHSGQQGPLGAIGHRVSPITIITMQTQLEMHSRVIVVPRRLGPTAVPGGIILWSTALIVIVVNVLVGTTGGVVAMISMDTRSAEVCGFEVDM